jgi:cytosine/adenosine deaminase-related metal-dependent hydrolase
MERPTMGTLLINHAARIETFDERDGSICDGSIFVRDGVIEAIGPAADLPAAERVVDARGCIVMPGLVNTHHHFLQTLTRAVPRAQNVELFDWLQVLYPIWARITPEAMRSATAIACAELLLSGCTTASDHTYVWPNGCRIEDQIEVVREIGLRYHAGRGSISIGQSQGGAPPDACVESEPAILVETQRAIERHHDAARFAMTRVVNAPCTLFLVSIDLMRESIALARSYGVTSHTHVAETLDEERYCLERFGRRPVEMMEQLGWVGPDVWHAHVVHPSPAEVARIGATRTGVAHCPTSNMRLGSGIAPIRALVDAGARVGIGVDGSASNDSSHLLDEARHMLLLQRVLGGSGALTAREALRIATRGGAAVLGRDDIGVLAPGMAADLIGIRLDTLEMAGGAVHDALAAVLFCRSNAVDFNVVHGEVLVEHGALTRMDVERLVARHNVLARQLVS